MKNNKGFTLVELLAVIAILAILVIIAIPNVLKMFNDSKKNAFIVQARKTANVSQEHTVLSNDKTFDCNSLLTGQKFKDCTATVDKNNQVTVDVLGSGTYENFLMVDVTPNANSGTFVDLSKLNTIDIGTEKEFKEPLIKNNKINEPTFKIMSGKEYVDLVSRVDNELSENEKNQFITSYDESIKNFKVENNVLKNTNSSNAALVLKVSFSKGKYTIPKLTDVGEILTETQIQACEKGKESDECTNSDKYYSVQNNVVTISTDKDEILYIGININGGGGISNFYLEKVLANKLEINADESIMLSPEEVSSYKDEGVSFKDKTLTGNDVYSYNNLKDKLGEYKYNYIIKTNQGVKILRRYITVANITSEKCFKFNKETQEIEQYYFVENNVSGGNKCPMDVVIPEKISGVQVKSIGTGAFGYDSCRDSIVKTAFQGKKYNITPIDKKCEFIPIGITSVILPEGLEYIGFEAFKGNNLKTVTIPSTVTKINHFAFENNQLQTVIFKGIMNNIKFGCDPFIGEKHSASVNALLARCE